MKNRYFPEVKWSSKSWTHNVFRFYEMIFGRRYGIRAEMSMNAYKYKGKDIVTYECYTFEAACALFESEVRKMLAFRFHFPYRIYIPALQTSNGFQLRPSPYLFAIALDTTAQTNTSGSASPVTYSYTCTGTDLIMFVNGNMNTGKSITSETYAAVSLTQIGVVQDTNGPRCYMHYLVGPATGANNLVVTGDGTVYAISIVSYSGAKQTDQLDSSSATVRDETTTSFAKSTTVVTNGSWIVCTSRTGSGNALTAGANTVMRQQPEAVALGAGGLWDTGGPQAPGSQTVTVTCSSQFFGGEIIASFKPSASAVVGIISNLLTLNVG